MRTIRFTTSEDGVDIAFWEVGDGKPIVLLNNLGISHSELEWTVPSIASFYTDLAESFRVVRYDPRGCGLSGEPPGGWGARTPSGAQQGFSAQEMGLDISAVAKALGLGSFALMGISTQGPVALEYAATHDEVSELILCESYAAVAASYVAPWLRAQNALASVSDDLDGRFNVWEKIGPRDEVEDLVRLARANRGFVDNTNLAVASQLEWNADRFLPDVSVPTLVLCSRGVLQGDVLSDSRHLAAGIAGSQVRVVDGSYSPYWSDRDAVLEAITAFLNPAALTGRLKPAAASFRTVVFTDIVSSTEYVRRVGDVQERAAIRRVEAQVANLARDHGGQVVKNIGDGSLVSFGSNSSAISFALELQHSRSDGPLRLRVGMAAGEPIQEDGDIHGTVVAHASRIGDLGGAGDIIVSDSVRQLAAGKGFNFESRGEVSLKGFEEPERVWSVSATTNA